LAQGLTRLKELAGTEGGAKKLSKKLSKRGKSGKSSRRVLAVDNDPQGNLTSNITADEVEADQVGLADVLSTRAGETLRDVIVPGVWPGLDVVPTTGRTLSEVRDELVIAGVGDGNLGAPALAACAAAAKKGVAIVRSSRTGGGVVERNIEIDDDRLGFVVADELNPQKARILLMLGLTRTSDPKALQEFFFDY
jgi:hypothetical protein